MTTTRKRRIIRIPVPVTDSGSHLSKAPKPSPHPLGVKNHTLNHAAAGEEGLRCDKAHGLVQPEIRSPRCSTPEIVSPPTQHAEVTVEAAAAATAAAAAAAVASAPVTPEAGVASLAAPDPNPNPNPEPTPTNSESDSQQDDLDAEKGCWGCCPWLPFTGVQRPLLRHRTRRDHAATPPNQSRSRSRARSLFARCRRRFGGTGRDILEELESVTVCNV